MLFPTRIWGGGVDSQQGRPYDVAPDGRFLINTERDTGTAPITWLMHWNPEAKTSRDADVTMEARSLTLKFGRN